MFLDNKIMITQFNNLLLNKLREDTSKIDVFEQILFFDLLY